MGGEKASINGLSADCQQRLVRPTVTTDKRHAQTDLPPLLDDESRFLVIAPHIDRVGLCDPDGTQLGTEINVSGRITLFADNGATPLFEFIPEIFLQIDAVILLHVGERENILSF